MSFYKTTAWKNKRKNILKRDKYLCRECKRYGKYTDATTIHHAIPLSEDQSLHLDSWNLISLCGKCHEKMHDRYTDILTEVGLRWKRKVLAERQEMINDG